MSSDRSRAPTLAGSSISRWKRAATVFGAATLLAPLIPGLLAFLTRSILGWWPTGGGAADLVRLAGTHVLLCFVFGALPAAAFGLVLSVLVWRKVTVSTFVRVAVSALCTLAYCLAVDLVFRGALARVMSADVVIGLTCLTVVTALIVHTLLRWARFI